jgi:hypothetical protein
MSLSIVNHQFPSPFFSQQVLTLEYVRKRESGSITAWKFHEVNLYCAKVLIYYLKLSKLMYS